MDAPVKRNVGAGFFHIDRRTWKIVCGLDDMNQAISYLTIAAGTGKGNRLSRWSAVAIQNHTGLAWKRGKPSIAMLMEGGFISFAPSSSVTRPVYELQNFAVVLDAARRRLTEWERHVISDIQRPHRRSKVQRAEMERLVMRGLLWPDGEAFSAESPKREPRAEFIWLPNMLITGTSNGDASPLKRLRQSRNHDALRLLVDLYSAQSLTDDGGVSRCVLEGTYTRKRFGDYGNRTVWGFTRQIGNAYPGPECTAYFWQRARSGQSEASTIWEALNTLSAMGLLMRVPHLVESEDRASEPIVGLAWDGCGERLEQAVAVAADAAARRLLPEVIWEHRADDAIVPVWSTMPNVAMVDIYRLRYRPQTGETARWLRQMKELATQWIEDYDQVQQRFTSLDAASR